MKKHHYLLILLFTLLLVACQNSTPPTPAATPTRTDTQAYWTLISQAQQAYLSADYATTQSLCREAIALNPDETTAWELYSQASIALAADAYLSEMPPHRWRIPVEVFIRDQVNHSRDWFIVDVRTPEEYAKGHIDGAINIPLQDLVKHLNALPSNKNAYILLYCHSQKRSTHALVILHELGYHKTYHLEGGYAAYQDWLSQNPLPTPGPTPTPEPNEPDFGC